MWFTEEAGAAYAELDPATGRITEHRTNVEGAKLAGLAFDCFGNLWVQYNQPGLIDRVRPDPTTSRYTLPTTAPVGHRIFPARTAPYGSANWPSTSSAPSPPAVPPPHQPPEPYGRPGPR
ncbi:hypothetical protein OSI21_13850 [Streptomyces libani]|uniref:hypothetical protein n=1 Tax=Streptomyces nigrescens TaxID=1920 RepID=UPI00225241C9|nr:hypothetical protein [Streptomyces libani]MCX5446582.1 hypothetical protein [Streptomyces libani]